MTSGEKKNFTVEDEKLGNNEEDKNLEDMNVDIINYYRSENPSASLTKNISDKFFIFTENTKRTLVYCKTIESEINPYRERIEKESTGPIPILINEHLEILSMMKKLAYSSVEYYVKSLASGSIEKFRTIKYDPIFFKYYISSEKTAALFSKKK